MEISEVMGTAITFCIGSYFMGWIFSYGLNVFRRFLLTASS